MKRKHVATGKKPPGGKRENAGRKPGSTNALGLGEVAAVKAAGLRVPEGATQAQRELADRALQRIAAVMEENVTPFAASAVLKASTVIREEICGPMKQRVEHSFDGLTDEQLEARFRAVTAKTTAAPPDDEVLEPPDWRDTSVDVEEVASATAGDDGNTPD